MDGYVYCGLSEQLATEEIQRDPLAKWYVAGGIPGGPNRDQIRDVVTQCMLVWGTVANVRAVEVPEEQADLVIHPHSIDGRMGVLADCMLPGPRVQVLRLDQSEMWTIHLGVDVSGALIDLYRVMLHELGHYWGMGHAPKNSKNLMAPTYSREIFSPRSWEIQGMQSLYGPPVAKKEQVSTYMAVFDQDGVEMRRYKLVEV